MESAANDDLGRSGHGGEEDHHRLHHHDRESRNDHQQIIRTLDLEYSRHHLDGSGNRGGDHVPVQEKDRLESARAEMGQVREENQMLKLYLDQMTRDYQTLQMRFLDFVKQGDKAPLATLVKGSKTDDCSETDQESALVSLRLGRAPLSTDSKRKHEEIDKPSPSSQRKGNGNHEKYWPGDEEDEDQRLKLGLECKFEVSKSGTIESSFPNSSPRSCSFEEQKEEEPGETWPPSKADLKTTKSGEDGVSQQNSNKRARVSVRARCDAPTMNDGCQWRKYGQKVAKGNPCPRAYYRCTIAPSCPVRKQVQRCAQDMSILITTYEGTHNHPLPMSATAMASTTSAAAQMLLSGSSSSTSHPGHGPSTAATDLILPGTSGPGAARSPLIYLPATSFSSSCPTITLDLTSSNPSSSSFSPHLHSRFNPSTFSPTSTLSFSSSGSTPGAFPITSWGINNGSGLLSYAMTSAYMNKNRDNNIGRIFHSSYASSIGSNDPLPGQSIGLPDAVAAATKAITTDPSFQSVLAEALRTIVAGTNGGAPGNPGGEQEANGRERKEISL